MEAKIDSIDMSEFDFELKIEDDILENINDNNLENTTRFEHKLQIDRTVVIITDDEYNALTDLLNKYITDNGVSFGFISYLLGDREW